MQPRQKNSFSAPSFLMGCSSARCRLHSAMTSSRPRLLVVGDAEQLAQLGPALLGHRVRLVLGLDAEQLGFLVLGHVQEVEHERGGELRMHGGAAAAPRLGQDDDLVVLDDRGHVLEHELVGHAPADVERFAVVQLPALGVEPGHLGIEAALAREEPLEHAGGALGGGFSLDLLGSEALVVFVGSLRQRPRHGVTGFQHRDDWGVGYGGHGGMLLSTRQSSHSHFDEKLHERGIFLSLYRLKYYFQCRPSGDPAPKDGPGLKDYI